MGISIATAPCCWGVDDIKNPNLPPWRRVFVEAAAAGYAGMHPVSTLEEYADRLDYIHFKDIDARVLADVMGRRIRFFEACAEGVMCPIGRGMIGYPAIRAALARIDYQGVITVEQERDPRKASGSLADVKASRDYLRSVGF